MLIELVSYVVVSYLFMALIGYIYVKDAVEIGSEVGLLGVFFLFAPLGAPLFLLMVIYWNLIGWRQPKW